MLWTDQRRWDSQLERFATVQRFPVDDIWRRLNRQGIAVYHLGNSAEFHGSIWEISRAHPGVVVLHDLCLQHLVAGRVLVAKQDPEAYLRTMEATHGRRGRVAARARIEGRVATEDIASSFPLTRLAVENALAVLVHSRSALQSIASLGPWPIAQTGLPFHLTSRGAPRVTKREGVELRLIVFGFLSPNRRLESVLRAMASLRGRIPCRLDVYGTLWDTEEVMGQIRGLGLGEVVEVHGFAPDHELHAALERADVAINLRYPTMGESSGSQLEIWNHELPSLVTRVGWYAELPESTVCFVQPERELDDLKEQILLLAENPELRAQIGRQGRCYLEEHHSPRAYAKTIVELVTGARDNQPRAAAWALAREVRAILAGHRMPDSRAAAQWAARHIDELFGS